MSARNDGGPAFPIPGLQDHAEFNGMSLRQYIAVKALQGLLAKAAYDPGSSIAGFVSDAYLIADQMIQEGEA